MYTVNTTKHVVAIFSEFNLVLNINHFSIPKQINEFFPLLHSAITFRAPVCIKKKNSNCELCFHQHRSHLHRETCLHTNPHLSVLFFVCASFSWWFNEQLPPKGRNLHRQPFMCSADAVCFLPLTSLGVGQQMEHLERQLTYGTKSLSSWSEQEESLKKILALLTGRERDESRLGEIK